MKRAPREIEAGSAAPAANAEWGTLARWLRIPQEPPAIPPGSHRWARSFRPAESFLRYLRFQYLMGVGVLALFMVPIGVGIAISVADAPPPTAFIVILSLVAGGLVTLALVGFLMLRLRFDTTWYVMTDRAVRVRRGVLTIRELTVTLDNVQNVKVTRGPIQRWLGIGNVAVETAAAGPADPQSGTTSASSLVLEGVADPQALRDRITERMRAARSSGLGDADEPTSRERPRTTSPGRSTDGRPRAGAGWTPAHLEALREIRAAVRQLG